MNSVDLFWQPGLIQEVIKLCEGCSGRNVRCFVDASGNIQRWILATMIMRLNKLNWGRLETGKFFNVESSWLTVEGQL
jgi:hypothetical protein